ncbi:hypothetical protein HY449_04025 [Candidatus Pacearchaeota archaeon]|nr:hypothetical protein [Candidatus Pacearchaeota archaeon]
MKAKNFCLFIFGMIFLIGVASSLYFNYGDGFSVAATNGPVVGGPTSIKGIATNNSDFWVIDGTDKFVYHFDSVGNNQSDGFSTTSAGAANVAGIATNSSDFWVLDNTDNFVYHFDRNGNNISDGFSVSAIGGAARIGITSNVTSGGTPTDFWIDAINNFVYHVNSTGGNYTFAGPVSSINAIGQPGFSISATGVSALLAGGITTNNSDFWITDSGDRFVYHFNKTGGNFSVGPVSSINAIGDPGFSPVYSVGSLIPGSIATNNSDFWITHSSSGNTLFVYHFNKSGFNALDGFLESGPVFPSIKSAQGIVANASDFWTTDSSKDFVYHFNGTGGNVSDGFSILSAGSGNSLGIATNSSDFWVTDSLDLFVYHFNRAGTNCTGVNCEAGFSTSVIGSASPNDIFYNNSDFWIVDGQDDFVYHLNKTGGNYTSAGPITSVNAVGTPGFSISSAGSTNGGGIYSNDSDFWIVDNNQGFVYHFDRSGNNQSDGFSTVAAGVSGYTGITSNGSDFWISDPNTIYHFTSSCNCPGINKNWQVDMSQSCTISSNCNLGKGKLTFYTSGSATCNAIINTTSMGLPASGATVFITSTGRINVY